MKKLLYLVLMPSQPVLRANLFGAWVRLAAGDTIQFFDTGSVRDRQEKAMWRGRIARVLQRSSPGSTIE